MDRKSPSLGSGTEVAGSRRHTVAELVRVLWEYSTHRSSDQDETGDVIQQSAVSISWFLCSI